METKSEAKPLRTEHSTEHRCTSMSKERPHVQIQLQTPSPEPTTFRSWDKSARTSAPHAARPPDPQDCARSLKDIAHVHAHLKILCLLCLRGNNYEHRLSRLRLRSRRSCQVSKSWLASVHQETRRISKTQTEPRTCAVTRPSHTPHASAFSRIAHGRQPAGVLQKKAKRKSTLEQNTFAGGVAETTTS